MKSNIECYAMHPKMLENWCLAEYVAKIELEFPKHGKQRTEDEDDEAVNDPECQEECDETVATELEGITFPFTMQNE